MTRRAVAMYLGSIVCIAWAVLTAVAWLRAIPERPVLTQWREPEDVQPPDPYTFGLSESTWNDGNATITLLPTRSTLTAWRPPSPSSGSPAAR